MEPARGRPAAMGRGQGAEEEGEDNRTRKTWETYGALVERRAGDLGEGPSRTAGTEWDPPFSIVAVGTQILQGVSLSETQASAIQLAVQLFCFPPTIPKGSIV